MAYSSFGTQWPSQGQGHEHNPVLTSPVLRVCAGLEYGVRELYSYIFIELRVTLWLLLYTDGVLFHADSCIRQTAMMFFYHTL